MFETLDRLMLAGLGAMSMTRQRAEEIFEDYVRRGKAERGGRARFVRELITSSQQARRDLEELVSKQVRDAIERLDLATKKDIARLEAKLDRLAAQMSS